MQLNSVETTVIAGVPLRAAFGYLSKPENMTEWSAVRDVQRESGRLKTGAEYTLKGKILFKKTTTRVVLTDYQLNKQFATRSQLGPFAFHDRYTFDPLPGGTQITQATRIRSRGPFRLLVPLLTALMRRGLRANLYRAVEPMEKPD